MVDFLGQLESCKFLILLGSPKGCSKCSVGGGRAGRFSAKAVGESRRKDLSLDLGQKRKVCCLRCLEWKCECVTWEETD